MNELKPCPFCGGEARLLLNAKRKIYGKDEYRTGVVACCNVCEARMFYGSEKLAIEAWNRRAESCNNLQSKLQQLATIPRPHENDLVFRWDAIEAIIRETNQDGAYGYGDTKSLVNVLDALPSAQPETNCSEIPNNSDTIYRQDAIDALDKEYRCTDRSNDWDGLKTAMLIIENLPSVQSRLNKKRISDLLWNEYRTMSPHLSAEGVVARRYYCKELWKELFGEEETPVWMTW